MAGLRQVRGAIGIVQSVSFTAPGVTIGHSAEAIRWIRVLRHRA
jgi:hypothetical protein